MKKRFWILAALLALSVLVAATAAALCGSHEQPGPANAGSEGYVLTSVDGELGVYRDGELILRTDIRLDSLRATDRALVEGGIRSDSYEEMLMLLEDLGA